MIRKKGQKGAVLKSQQEHVNEYCFDEAFGATSTQDEVYRVTAAKHVPAVLEGSNVTVIAYGATGAGKVRARACAEVAHLRALFFATNSYWFIVDTFSNNTVSLSGRVRGLLLNCLFHLFLVR